MILKGNSVSSGVAFAQVINTETNDNPNDSPCVLVTRSFTPDIIANYKNIMGIISENGGATCRAAVLARTMGIPCITGVNNASMILQTGQWVLVNAGELMKQGIVEVKELI